ncbi:hypothetical protein P4O66_002939 [Electrophorus voltai]|uniref:Reverse transcriptase/retrotransposon-derived protein RNase H-like domain-containing protein n=1 Tax=Electrophorus voltai TaxID=2609070 RepID=A0AAD8YWV8_9TELE|nr:hypothetical protein P4O66_002939 [Electrophorus voltai]
MLWAKKKIQQWAPSCYQRCFPNKAVPLQATSIESPEAGKQVPIPLEYQDLEQVFSPSKATWHPPHQDWDCAVTLKEEAVRPQCRIYPLSQEEEQAMAQYIKEVLQQGYVRPSTSLASAGVNKKNSTSCWCSTYQLRGPVRKIKWTQEVDKAFEELKNAFATASVLQQLDPGRPFVVEVDASDIGVVVVLSQHTGERGGLRPHRLLLSEAELSREELWGWGP